MTIILRTGCGAVAAGFGSVCQVTPDDLADETGARTRRALRRRTSAVPVAAPAAVVTRAETGTLGAAHSGDDDPAVLRDAESEDDRAFEGLIAVEDDATVEDDAIVEAVWADDTSPPTALLWVDPVTVEAATEPASLEATQSRVDGPDLLAGAPRRGILRGGYLVPLSTLVALGIAYSGTTLLWPLHELPPTVEAVEFDLSAAEPATPTWPAQGSAAISVDGVGVAASAAQPVPIASITKVVSVMLVLDRLPLQPGEQGPEFSFTSSDSREYWSYLRDNQSAVDVPVGGSLTEYQMLQGILLGSANNYIDRLTEEIWGSDRAFAAAAEQWLAARGLSDITIVTPAGRNAANVASPESLTALAAIAMSNPVFAEIVGTKSVDLPGVGTVTNSNGLLADPGFIGVKTGTLDGGYNVLSAKEVAVGDTTVRLYAAVLGQESNDARLAASRALYTEVEAALQAQGPAMQAGTVVGEVSTPWDTTIDVVTDTDASVVLWNSAVPTAEVVFDLGDAAGEDDAVGALTVAGPIDSVEVPVSLAEDIEGPSPWWRLTHPFELLGITD